MLCKRCGSHVPETSDSCPTCGLKYDAAARQAAGASARKRGAVEGAPYKAGDVAAGRYAIRELVGAGPVGYVFRALDQTHDVEVALKVINPRLLQEPEERTQFSLVLRVGKKLGHPHLLRVYEEGFDQDRPFFTTQLVEGMTLRRMMEMRVAKGQPFTLREVEPLLGQLASALDAAHRYGPHSDLKPENIIVLPDMLKVTDYGLALGLPRPPFVQAQKGFRADGYIAPEYASGGEIDTRMDLYSLAAIVGEMLTGLMPDGDGIPEVLMKNPDLPPAFEALYRRALNANPTARPRTAGEFAAEFSSIVASNSSGTSRPPKSAPPVGQSASSSTARTGDKPPPPVPTDQLPVVNIAPPVMVRPALKDDAPVDATQPMDAAMLAAIMAAPPGTAPPAGGQAPAPSEPVAKPTAQVKPAEPRPAPKANASPAPTPPRAAAKPAAAPRPKKAPDKRSQPVLWLVLLTVAGLATGSAGGYVLLKRLRAGQETGTPAVGGQDPGRTQPVNPQASPVSDPMAPAGSCPPGMRLVSGGTFKMGAPAGEKDKTFDERELENVQVASFCIDEYEHPNQKGNPPTINVSWLEAKQACESLSKRLCTEEEWEKACKGPGSARFPYGNDFDPDRCNTEDASNKDRAVAASGSFPQCRSAYGVMDLSGNVTEWTSSTSQDGTVMAQKGGNFARSDSSVRCSARRSVVPTERDQNLGFRCCAGVGP
ncbi:SUMF1/EgtB/PvdO family nonheme iron enzyme [Hyalangium rubrum]|uniref:SUMF1/EgtB/PvdO family nonheme iron enzyme n=1 Tax=Hyalangium rubrum TaxID=3103134 RepID=A0ABU5H6Q6_9BACT|nr:SUMF1/EgtB/PvdO family nonheme iron enzyme [Hyalangium sp. s54d21]MDY7228774.1 SUMF1/EgtB/PvdO family nonheme iron enzyme [Hyalangium sp. s54d21]